MPGLQGFARYLSRSLESISEDGVEREYVFFGKMENPDELIEATRWEDQEQWRILVPCKEEDREISVRIRATTAGQKDLHASTDQGGQSEATMNRHLVKWEDTRYTLTIKSWKKGDPGTTEAEIELDPKEGKAMLPIFRQEGDGMIKRRYFFPIDEESSKRLGFDKEVFDDAHAVWEVDVFWTGEQWRTMWADTAIGHNAIRFHPYVKLDLEVRSFEVEVTQNADGEYNNFSIPFPITLSDVVYSQPHQRTARDKSRVEEIMEKYMRAKK